jgi:succinate dehydrogenase / fumarate reductase iron-sulfur subunit
MENIVLKVKRQDDPDGLPYWERLDVPYEYGMTVAAALVASGRSPATANGAATAPVACDISCMEGTCGSCMMLINGKLMLACRTFVDDLASPITLAPIEKFPVDRDL